MKIIVLAKQVPDTRNVGKDAMKEDGTINRAVLPAIFNPEDLNALEQALVLKEQHPGSTITLLTMGPPRASEIIKEAIYRGADNGYLLTDRAFAGADTLATSYALATAIKHICGTPDVILCGRQAIDGDTAQVGPQVAQKLGLNAITYCEEIQRIENKTITVKRRLERGVEIVKAPLPLLVTVTGSAVPCRSRNAKRLQKYKYAATPSEIATATEVHQNLWNECSYLHLHELSAADINADLEQCGLNGSPTKVKKVENVVFKSKEVRRIAPTDQEIEELVRELMNNHTIG